MSESHDKFDDPVLKGAVRKACGKPSAPPELARKLQQLARAESGTASVSSKTLRIPWGLVGVAAMLLIGGGLAWVMTRSTAEPVPSAIFAGVCQMHDLCAHATNHHHVKGVPLQDYSRIATVMANDLNVPVLAADLGNGWVFNGAAPCPVGSHTAAHLTYNRGSEHVSVFSLSVKSCRGGPEGKLYKTADPKHPTAAFVTKGAFVCVTGTSDTGQMSLKEIVQIRDQLRGISPATPASVQTASKELLVPRCSSASNDQSLAHLK